MAIQIKEHRPGQDLTDFVRLPELLYTGDPGFVMPLYMEQKDRLSPNKNPFFTHGEAALFTAYRNGELVGRCSAQIDRLHLERYGDDVGFFGFFDSTNDQRVATSLVDAAANWLSMRGMKTMRGPMSLSMNEECGLLVHGHSEPSMLMMPYCRPYQQQLAEGAGLNKAKDLLAWRYEVGDIPKRALKAHEGILQLPEIRLRSVRKSQLTHDVKAMVDIFNDAWKDNWGNVAITAEEADKMAEDMGLFLREELAFIAELEGEPVAMCVALPNVNEAARDLSGRLFPFGLPKLLWRLKVQQPKSARLMLLGIKSKLRNKKRYGGLSAALYVEIAKRGSELGYEWAELGWTLEDNRPVNLGIKSMGGREYKRYRIYEKGIG